MTCTQIYYTHRRHAYHLLCPCESSEHSRVVTALTVDASRQTDSRWLLDARFS